MKKSIKKALTIGLLFVPLFSLAQVDWNTAGNTINTIEWFGANAASTIPLQIRHDGNYPINIYTSGSQRMLIRQGGNSTASGRIAMGNNLPNNFVPANRLHLHQTGFTTANLYQFSGVPFF